METKPLLFWKPGPAVKLSAPEIARELVWGEEVEGLIDLPVREIIDKLKSEFPQHEEKSGLLVGQVGGGSFEVTWSWQHVRIESRDLPDNDRERLIDTIESFDCMAYEQPPDSRSRLTQTIARDKSRHDYYGIGAVPHDTVPHDDTQLPSAAAAPEMPIAGADVGIVVSPWTC